MEHYPSPVAKRPIVLAEVPYRSYSKPRLVAALDVVHERHARV